MLLRERMPQCREPCIGLAGSVARSLVLAMVAESSDAGIETGMSRRTTKVMSMYNFLAIVCFEVPTADGRRD